MLELRQYLETKANIRIPHSVVLSRVNSMVTTRALQMVKERLWALNVCVLATPIIKRSACRDLFGYVPNRNAVVAPVRQAVAPLRGLAETHLAGCSKSLTICSQAQIYPPSLPPRI